MRLDITIKKNTKKWDTIVKNLTKANSNTAQIGWWESTYPMTNRHQGIPVAQVAAWNEQGHYTGGKVKGGYAPPRPFMRVGLTQRIKSTKLLERYVKKVSLVGDGKLTWAELHRQMGREIVKLLQLAIAEWKTPKNRPLTIDWKGFDEPLIESGRLMGTVKLRVRSR